MQLYCRRPQVRGSGAAGRVARRAGLWKSPGRADFAWPTGRGIPPKTGRRRRPSTSNAATPKGGVTRLRTVVGVLEPCMASRPLRRPGEALRKYTVGRNVLHQCEKPVCRLFRVPLKKISALVVEKKAGADFVRPKARSRRSTGA